MTTAVFGGAFDPPHNGHVALVSAALERFAPTSLVVLVAAAPGHKRVDLDAGVRVQLAKAAFPDFEVELDHNAYTIDALRSRRWRDPLFLMGADVFADFLSWNDPEAVLAHARLGVATRPGYPRERLEGVLALLQRAERVEFFEIEPFPISSRELRGRVSRGESIATFVPPGVSDLVARLGLYREPARAG